MKTSVPFGILIAFWNENRKLNYSMIDYIGTILLFNVFHHTTALLL